MNYNYISEQYLEEFELRNVKYPLIGVIISLLVIKLQTYIGKKFLQMGTTRNKKLESDLIKIIKDENIQI
jgi:hypothetical protein